MSHSAKSINYWHYYRRLLAIFSAPTCRGQLWFSRLYVQQVGADYLITPWANVPSWTKISVCKWRWSGLMEKSRLHHVLFMTWPGNTRHWPNVGSLLDRRRRRRATIDPTLVHCIVCWVSGLYCGSTPPTTWSSLADLVRLQYVTPRISKSYLAPVAERLRTKSWDISLDCHIRKYRGIIRSKIVFFRITNISVPCTHA